MALLEPGRAREILDRLPSPVGYGLLAVGVALLVLPGPGIPFLLGGLAVLSRRRPWARRARRRLRLHLARGLRRRGRAPRRVRPPSGR
jgi:hypothetical protein